MKHLLDKFERTRTKLMNSHPFYALMLQRCRVEWLTDVKTAGVGFDRNEYSIRFVLSPQFFESLSDNHSLGLFIHEMDHLFLDHLRRGKAYDNKKVANVAMDCVINQYIPIEFLPDGACLPDKFNLPKGEAFNTYYQMLMKKSEDEIDKANAELMDNHEFSEEMQGEKTESEGNTVAQAIQDECMEKMGQEIARQAGKMRGNIPMHIEQAINELGSKNNVNWRRALKSFVGRNISKDFDTTRTRANRRLGLGAQGNKASYFPKIIVGIDQSQSVDNELNSKFLTELKSLLKNVEGITEIVYFDTAIAKTEKLKKAADVKLKRYAAGGTDFNCLFQYAKDKKPDALIVLTDGECPYPSVQVKCPVLWALPELSKDFDHLKGKKVQVT